MSKKMSRFSAILMTLVMAIGMLSTTTFAAPPLSLQPDKGTLTIHKYLMDDASQAGPSNDGTEVTTLPTDAVPLDGITFKLYKVTIATSGPNAGKVPQSTGGYTVNTTTNKLTSGGIDYDIVYVKDITTADGTGADAKGIGKSGDLDKGIYLLVEQEDSRVTSPAAPFVVSVPMTNAAGDGWITDVHVYPKNEKMSVTKTPDVTSVEIGQIVTWTIDLPIPSDVKDAKLFDVLDKLDNALDFVPGSVTVKGLATAAGAGTNITPANYAVTTSPHTDTITGIITDELKVSFDTNGRIELGGYKFLKITFQTKVNKNILDRINYTVENVAEVDFTNQYGENKKPKSPVTKVHTAIIGINKTDANTGAALKDAIFQIASSEQNAKDGNFLKKDSAGNIVDFGDPGYATAEKWEAKTDMQTTGTYAGKAMAFFKGLRDYTGPDTAKVYSSYWLVETTAPAGYNLLGEIVKVTFDATTSSEAAAYTLIQSVLNTKGFTLPKTGGMGTVMFAVGGVVLIGMAVILIVTSRKKRVNA